MKKMTKKTNVRKHIRKTKKGKVPVKQHRRMVNKRKQMKKRTIKNYGANPKGQKKPSPKELRQRKKELELELGSLDREISDVNSELALHEWDAKQAETSVEGAKSEPLTAYGPKKIKIGKTTRVFHRKRLPYQKEAHEQAIYTKELLVQRRTPLVRELEQIEKDLEVKKIEIKPKRKKAKQKKAAAAKKRKKEDELESIPIGEGGIFFKLKDVKELVKEKPGSRVAKERLGVLRGVDIDDDDDDDDRIEIIQPKTQLSFVGNKLVQKEEPTRDIEDIVEDLIDVSNIAVSPFDKEKYKQREKIHLDLQKELERATKEKKKKK